MIRQMRGPPQEVASVMRCGPLKEAVEVSFDIKIESA